MIKKILLSSAFLSVQIGVAHAQSSVTLFGVLDGGVRFLTNATPTGGHQVTMNSNGFHNNNRIDFSGVEDLGDGLNAHFLLESGFLLNSGALDNTSGLIFNRQSYVGLGGWFGSIDAGRQWTTAHDIIYYYDPFALTYTGILPLSAGSDGTRVSNDIKYTGTFGGLNIIADNSLGGIAGNFNQSASRAAAARYTWGPVSIGGAYGYRNLATTTMPNVFTGDNFYMAGAYYQIGPVKLAAGYMDEDQKNIGLQPSLNTKNYWGGVSYQVTPFVLLQVGNYQTSVADMTGKKYSKNMWIAGVTYFLSKRTQLYAEGDYTHFKGVGINTLNTTGRPQQIGVTVGMNFHF